MIEEIICDYLIKKNIAGVGNNVGLETPKKPPAKYIVIEKVGSGGENLLGNAIIAIQSISAVSLYEAATLNEIVKQAMFEMPDSQNVYGVKLNSDYNFTNTETKEYRYQAVFNIYY